MGDNCGYICLAPKHATSFHFRTRKSEPSCPECGGRYGDTVFDFRGEEVEESAPT